VTNEASPRRGRKNAVDSEFAFAALRIRPSPASRREAPSPGGRRLGNRWCCLDSHGLRHGLNSFGPPGLAADRNDGVVGTPLIAYTAKTRDVYAAREYN